MTSNENPSTDLPLGLGQDKVKWTTDLAKSIDKEKVEDEVLDAVEEGKEKISSEQNKINHLPVNFGKDNNVEPYKRDPETEDSKEAQEAKEAKKVADREAKNALLRGNPKFISSLRNADRPYNRTCSQCLTRKPLDQFFQGKEGQICIECVGSGGK